MSFKGSPPKSSRDDPNTCKAGYANYQGHELFITWLITCPNKAEYQKNVEKLCCEVAIKHGHTTIGIRALIHSTTRMGGGRGKYNPDEAHITAAFGSRKCENAHIYVGPPSAPKEKMSVWRKKGDPIKCMFLSNPRPVTLVHPLTTPFLLRYSGGH
ncbi:hypothetical protein N431DRAFT_442924 [Stipitochalara longipes BDJ]|nr:hypothetical protein N431DRAFT_442924 [Stipitochalara longipes BDJ]